MKCKGRRKNGVNTRACSQADMTDNRVSSDPTSGGIAFCSGFTAPPLLFANLMTYQVSRRRREPFSCNDVQFT